MNRYSQLALMKNEKMIKRSIVKIIKSWGYSIPSNNKKYQNIAIELDDNDIDLIRYVLDRGYTMTTVPRLVMLLKIISLVTSSSAVYGEEAMVF